MIYRIIFAQEDLSDFTLFEVNIPKEERYNIAVALFCEIEHNAFAILGGIIL